MLVVVALGVVVVATIGGLALGSSPIAPERVLDALLDYDPTQNDHLVVIEARLPRVLLGIAAGAALGVAGAVMQSFTRNPLADPGILGVNAGAAAAVVVAIAFFGIGEVTGYVWFALLGAAVGAVSVYLLGAAHRSSATPARMALAGAAVSMAIGAATGMVLISHETAFFRFRYWAVGTLQGRHLDVLYAVAPFIVAGLILALLLTRSLNAIALGEDAARGLGVNLHLGRGGAAGAVVLLAGAATAAVGPIAFVGLAAPHIVRSITGPDHRLLLPAVLVVSPAVLLTADLLGRIAVAPGELQTGIAAAILGGPLFVALVRSRRIASL